MTVDALASCISSSHDIACNISTLVFLCEWVSSAMKIPSASLHVLVWYLSSSEAVASTNTKIYISHACIHSRVNLLWSTKPSPWPMNISSVRLCGIHLSNSMCSKCQSYYWPALCAGLLCCNFFDMLTPVPFYHFFSSLILLFIYV